MQSAQAGQLEFLIKAVEGTTAALICDLKVGDEADVSPVMGKGFNMEALQPPEDWSTVIIFATGSGIRLVICQIRPHARSEHLPDSSEACSACVCFAEVFVHWIFECRHGGDMSLALVVQPDSVTH